MHTGQGRPWSWFLLALVLLAQASFPSPRIWGQTGRPQPPSPGQPIPLTVTNNQCECVLPTPRPDTQYLLILGSLSSAPGSYRVTVRTDCCESSQSISEEKPAVLVSRKLAISDSDIQNAKSEIRITPSESVYPPAEEVPRTRNFFLFVKERDIYSSDSYVTVSGELQGLGRHCQVYVDREYLSPTPPLAGEGQGRGRSRIQPTVDDIIRTFDESVYPRACRTLGRAADVDRDGRFTILLTPWLGKLADGKVSLGGFVRGSDFFRDLAPPFGNRCDMMYLNTDLQPGPTLRTILAHEYTHAVIFSEHVFGSYQPQAPRQDEEGWLNEGIAHMVEDQHGFSWSNLDYRVSAFLNAPERYQLVVPDYFRAGLFRSHGHRGATYLFLRWCCDCYGNEVLKSLVQSNLAGIANVEAATRHSFADLFRQWTTALALSGTNLTDIRSLGDSGSLMRLDLHQPLAGRILCGPRFTEMLLGGDRQEAALAGTGAGFFLLHSPNKCASRMTITADPESNLQVTLIRLPKQTARLSLRVEPQKVSAANLGAQSVRVSVTAHDQEVTLDQAAWERLVPTANRPEDTSYRMPASYASSTQTTVQTWFGNLRLKAGETKTSEPISIPTSGGADEHWVFKISAVDSAGHHISAWAIK